MAASDWECICEVRSVLGEGPVWDERTQRLCFIDIEAPALLRLDPATRALERWPMPAKIGCFALDRADGALLALASGMVRFDFRGTFSPVADPPWGAAEGEAPHRFNDGAVDPLGRFWAGSMAGSGRRRGGAIFRLAPAGRLETVYEGFHVPNGLGWSPEGRRFYFSDSQRAMFVADFDRDDGVAGAPWVLADVSAAPGYPDGMAVDEEGCLWSARWDGGGIARFAADGRLLQFIPLPVSRATSCAFGGPRRDRLFVTSARIGLDAAALAREPLAGAVFALDPGVRGLPQRRWGGLSSH